MFEVSGSSLQCVLLLGWAREGWGSFSQRDGKLLFSHSLFPRLVGEQDPLTAGVVDKETMDLFSRSSSIEVSCCFVLRDFKN